MFSFIKGTLSCWRQFLTADENPLKMVGNASCFISKAPFLLAILKFYFPLFGHLEKRFDEKDQVNFKTWETWENLPHNLGNNQNTHISRSKGNQRMKFGQLKE